MNKIPKLQRHLKIDLSQYNNYDLYKLKEDLEQLIIQRQVNAQDLLTPTILGTHLGLNAVQTNKVIERMGLQVRVDTPELGKFWMPTNEGLVFCEVFKIKELRLPDTLIYETDPKTKIIRHLESYNNPRFDNVKWVVHSSYYIKWKPIIIQIIIDFLDKESSME